MLGSRSGRSAGTSSSTATARRDCRGLAHAGGVRALGLLATPGARRTLARWQMAYKPRSQAWVPRATCRSSLRPRPPWTLPQRSGPVWQRGHSRPRGRAQRSALSCETGQLSQMHRWRPRSCTEPGAPGASGPGQGRETQASGQRASAGPSGWEVEGRWAGSGSACGRRFRRRDLLPPPLQCPRLGPSLQVAAALLSADPEKGAALGPRGLGPVPFLGVPISIPCCAW